MIGAVVTGNLFRLTEPPSPASPGFLHPIVQTINLSPPEFPLHLRYRLVDDLKRSLSGHPEHFGYLLGRAPVRMFCDESINFLL